MDKKNIKKIVLGICIAIIVAYFAIPPYNKIAQIGYYMNNLKFCVEGQEVDAYIFHRNNAIYLTKMDHISEAIKEMDKAVSTFPPSASDNILYSLYKDRANIKMYYGDYKGALNDYLRIPSHGLNDYLIIAMLLKENKKNKLALSYCNKILDMDINAYAGYACMADVYSNSGKNQSAVVIFDLLINRFPSKAKFYADRAKYKEKSGDIVGAKDDYQHAKDLSPLVDMNSSITYDAIHPKKLNLSVL